MIEDRLTKNQFLQQNSKNPNNYESCVENGIKEEAYNKEEKIMKFEEFWEKGEEKRQCMVRGKKNNDSKRTKNYCGEMEDGEDINQVYCSAPSIEHQNAR